ncbi:flagellar hook-length control protein FliK [bacterium BMS3Bbin03]|nr:flagellar hook-length control protein FliK [bacterium BMS3Bbin03]
MVPKGANISQTEQNADSEPIALEKGKVTTGAARRNQAETGFQKAGKAGTILRPGVSQTEASGAGAERVVPKTAGISQTDQKATPELQASGKGKVSAGIERQSQAEMSFQKTGKAATVLRPAVLQAETSGAGNGRVVPKGANISQTEQKTAPEPRASEKGKVSSEAGRQSQAEMNFQKPAKAVTVLRPAVPQAETSGAGAERVVPKTADISLTEQKAAPELQASEKGKVSSEAGRQGRAETGFQKQGKAGTILRPAQTLGKNVPILQNETVQGQPAPATFDAAKDLSHAFTNASEKSKAIPHSGKTKMKGSAHKQGNQEESQAVSRDKRISQPLSEGFRRPVLPGQKNQLVNSNPAQSALKQFPKEMFQKLVQSTRLLIQEGGSQMQIQLKPDILGTVRLLVETMQNQIDVKIFVDKPATRDLLEQHVQALQHSLAKQGFKTEQIQISLNVQSDPFQQGQSFQQNRQQRLFQQRGGGNPSSNAGNFTGLQGEQKQTPLQNRRFGYNSVEYVA